ncbi:MAG: molybdopterin-binding protein [Actinomycetaceae bacterium]|nr:molybdopterin-binding protein [Actinomycetaceae bacterium]
MSNITAAVITVDSRVVNGIKEDGGARMAVELLSQAGIMVVHQAIIDDEAAPLRGEFDRARGAGARLVVTVGSTGVSARNIVPETTAAICDIQLPGVAQQIFAEGLKSTPLAGLSRGIVGITSRTSQGAVIVNAPSRVPAVADALNVLIPLLPYIYDQMDQTEI